MTYRTRKRLALAGLVLGLPVYIVLVGGLVGRLDRPHVLVEIAIYVGAGMAWILPLRGLFRGLGREAPPEAGGQGDQGDHS